MTPREPNRFDKRVKELAIHVEELIFDGDTECGSRLRWSLRRIAEEAESSALERAAHRLEEIARDYENRKLRSEAMGEINEAGYVEQMARAAWRCVKAVYEMKAPAAAPAAEPSEPVAPAPLVALLREAARRTPDLDFQARILDALETLADGGER